MAITLRLREIREAKGWSQVDLAQRSKVRQATISSFERGQMTRALVTLDRLAKTLGVPLAELFEKR